jgi:hypothetical protein
MYIVVVVVSVVVGVVVCKIIVPVDIVVEVVGGGLDGLDGRAGTPPSRPSWRALLAPAIELVLDVGKKGGKRKTSRESNHLLLVVVCIDSMWSGMISLVN